MTASLPPRALPADAERTIATARLLLEPLQPHHAPEMFGVLADARLYGFTGGIAPRSATTLAESYTFLAKRRSPDGTELWLNWVLREPVTGQLAGYVQATVGEDHADVAWVVGVAHQRRGYASEAALAVVAWLEAFDLAEVRACVHPDHDASRGVARNAGLQRTERTVDGEEVWVLQRTRLPRPAALDILNSMSTDFAYPIGPFVAPAAIDAAARAHSIGEIAEAPALLRRAAEGLDDAQLDTRYRDGGWTVRQVVHHVADSHMNAYIRFKLALTEEAPLVKTYEETLWAELPDGRTAPIEPSLRLLELLHERWVLALRATAPGAFSRPFRHPDRGLMTIDSLLALYAWHGRHHAAHITRLRERTGW